MRSPGPGWSCPAGVVTVVAPLVASQVMTPDWKSLRRPPATAYSFVTQVAESTGLATDVLPPPEDGPTTDIAPLAGLQ